MDFNIKQIPFSRFGSFLSVSYLTHNAKMGEGIYLRNIRGGDDGDGAIFKLEIIKNDKLVPFETHLNATNLVLKSDQGWVKCIFPKDDYVHFHGENVGFRLTLVAGAYDNAFWHKEQKWQINVFSKKIRFMLNPMVGNLDMDIAWNVNRCSHVIANFIPKKGEQKIEGTIEEFLTTYQAKETYTPFEKAEQEVQAEFNEWYESTPSVPKGYKKGKQLASYITWSSVVKKEGQLTRQAMYMSKNWMTNIWSWDNCFNSMALINNDPDLAWDQYMIFFDVQDPGGQLPDFINDQYAYWNCTKPPIHGWTLSWMLNRTDSLSKDKLREIYTPLSKWTNWYFQHRDVNNNGLPEYHHGNDSGWDNSTVFHEGIPVESPDLAAFLILQMETLADIAEKLHMMEEKEMWEKSAEQLLDNMLNEFWDGEKLVAKHLGDKVDSGDSLLLFMPIVLGDRLPKEVLQKLIEGLKEEGRFLTNHGLATESLNSPYYMDDGYWRGPIWAPSTMLFIDSLFSVGEKEFAQELARKYCDMTLKSGMAENYNAKTGDGLRDRAFTWTSSVFLILANEYLDIG